MRNRETVYTGEKQTSRSGRNCIESLDQGPKSSKEADTKCMWSHFILSRLAYLVHFPSGE